MSENNGISPLTIRHWLLQTLVTSTVVCVMLVALAALFLPDGIFDTGKDPAISAQEEYLDTKNVHARLVTLEQHLQSRTKAAAKNNATGKKTAEPDLVEVQVENVEAKLERTSKAAEEYETRLRELQDAAIQESRIARMVVGMTQLKAAYEGDVSLENGINLLKNTVQDEKIQEKLVQLDTLVQEKLPTRQEILTHLHLLQDNIGKPDVSAPQASPVADTAAPESTGGWVDAVKSRAQGVVDQFVQVRPTENVKQDKTLDRIIQAVNLSDYPLAAQLAAQLPENPTTKLLVLKLQTRAKAQGLVQGVVSGVTNMVSNPNTKGALY